MIEIVFNNSEDFFTDLNGYIIARISSGNEKGSFVINLQNKEKEIIDSDISHRFTFAENKNQLLTSLGNELYLYDTNLKSTKLICRINIENKNIYNVRYIDNNYVCFISNDRKLVLYNIKTREEKVLSSDYYGEYSYTSDRKKIYYYIDNKIYSIDIDAENGEYITDGNNPMISKNGNVYNEPIN